MAAPFTSTLVQTCHNDMAFKPRRLHELNIDHIQSSMIHTAPLASRLICVMGILVVIPQTNRVLLHE